MPVPKTPMHKNNGAEFRKDDVRLSRQIASMQAKPEAQLMEEGADLLFRGGID